MFQPAPDDGAVHTPHQILGGRPLGQTPNRVPFDRQSVDTFPDGRGVLPTKRTQETGDRLDGVPGGGGCRHHLLRSVM